MPQPTPILPFGSYRPDVVDYEGINSQAITNVVRRGDGYGPFPDLETLTTSLPAPCRGAFTAQAPNGQQITFAGTATKLYMLDNTLNTWGDVSRSGGTYTTLATTAQWQFLQFNDLVFATQANDVLQVFNLNTPNTFINQPGSPPQAAFIVAVGQFVVLLGLLNLPFRMQWSGLGDPSNWTAGLSSSDFQDFTDGGITQGAAGGEYGVIFQVRVIRQMTYAPGSSYIFQITRICEDQGLLAPYALARAESQIFFLSAQGWQQLAPGVLPIPIGKEKIDRSFFEDWDNSNPQLLIGTNDPNSTRVAFGYKSVNGNHGVMDTVLLYDYILQDWTPIHGINNGLGIEYLFTAAKSGVTLDGLDSTYTPLATISGARAAFGNVLLQANNFPTSPWTDFNTGLTSNFGPDPQGGNTAWQFVRQTIGASTSFLQQIVTKSASVQTYTFSIWAKSGTHAIGGVPQYVSLYADDNAGGNWAAATFNLQTPVVTSSNTNGTFTSLTSSISNFGTWSRFSITFKTNTSTSLRVAFTVNSNGSLLNQADSVVGSTMLCWGAQLENLPIATFNVLTTTAPIPIVELTISTTALPTLVAAVDGTSSPTAMFNNMQVDIEGVVGTIEANGEQQVIVVIDSTHILLQRVPFSNAYVSGGFIAGTIDVAAQQTSFDSYPFAGLPALAAFDNAGALGYFTGANLEASLESSEHSAAGQRLRCQGFRPITDSKFATGTMSIRESLQTSRIYGTPFPITTQGIIPVKRSGRYMRARLIIPAGDSWTYATGVEPITDIDGER